MWPLRQAVSHSGSDFELTNQLSKVFDLHLFNLDLRLDEFGSIKTYAGGFAKQQNVTVSHG
jgi:hypothetical protein